MTGRIRMSCFDEVFHSLTATMSAHFFKPLPRSGLCATTANRRLDGGWRLLSQARGGRGVHRESGAQQQFAKPNRSLIGTLRPPCQWLERWLKPTLWDRSSSRQAAEPPSSSASAPSRDPKPTLASGSQDGLNFEIQTPTLNLLPSSRSTVSQATGNDTSHFFYHLPERDAYFERIYYSEIKTNSAIN